MAKKGSQLLAFVLALVVWMLMTWELDPGNLMVGALVSLAGSLLYGEAMAGQPHKALNPLRYLWFLYYLPVFLWEMVKANIDVAYRVLHPRLPIDPGLVKIRTGLKSETGRTLLGNSLTLTPGNTTVDIIGDQLYIHCIDVNRRVDVTAGRYEKIIARIFE